MLQYIKSHIEDIYGSGFPLIVGAAQCRSHPSNERGTYSSQPLMSQISSVKILSGAKPQSGVVSSKANFLVGQGDC